MEWGRGMKKRKSFQGCMLLKQIIVLTIALWKSPTIPSTHVFNCPKMHFISFQWQYVCVWVGVGVCVCVCVWEREREREMITQDMSNAKWVLLENRCDDRMRWTLMVLPERKEKIPKKWKNLLTLENFQRNQCLVLLISIHIQQFSTWVQTTTTTNCTRNQVVFCN